MADRPSPFETQLDTVLRRIGEIDVRLRALEDRFATVAPLHDLSVATQQAGRAERGAARRGFNPLVIASLTGRTSLVLGGGYLLRALTDLGVLSLPVGVTLGFVYAIAWILVADRDGRMGRSTSAAFHVFAATALAFPLLYEAVFRFNLVHVWEVSIALSAVAALGIAVAWRRSIESIVWIISLAAVLTVLAFFRAGADLAPFALHLVVLSALTYAVAVARGWRRVRWLPALVADGAVVWLVIAIVTANTAALAWPAIAVALALFVISLASFAIRILVLGDDVVGFELFQSAAALGAGYGGAIYMVRTAGLDSVPFGAAAMALGVAAYAVAFGVAPALTRRNFLYFSTVAIALVIVGGTLALAAPVATALWIALALAGVYLGRSLAHGTLSVHGAAYLVAATVASGLFLEAGYGLLGPAGRPWRDVTPIALVALVAVALCSTVAPSGVRAFRASKVVTTIAAHRASVGWPRAIALALLVLGVAGVVIVWIAPAIGRVPGPGGAGALATARTAALAVAVIAMAMLARDDRVREARMLIYPLLIATGVKILLEDFQQSQPTALFVALVIYGSVLIVGPRLASK